MNELLKEKTKFENQKNKLRKFSNNIPSSVNLPNSKTESGLFGWFNHKVTGDQFNNLTNKIQTYLKATNSQVIKIIREFHEVYNTFETLDKEYLNKIIASVKAVEIVSNQAKTASNKANNNSNDIKKIIEVQKITIDKLVQFKDKFESVHQIDDKWNYIKKLKEQINSIQENLILNKRQTDEQITLQEQNTIKQKEVIIELLDNISSNISTKINSISQTQTEQNQNLNREIKSVQNNFNENKRRIDEQITLQEQNAIKQKEVIIELLDNLSSDISTKINSVSQTQTEQNQSLNREIKSIHSDIASIKNKIKIQERQLSKKIIIAFILVGIFGSISVIHIILNIFGVL